MSNLVSKVLAAPDFATNLQKPILAPESAVAPKAPMVDPSAPVEPNEGDLRLVIEQDKARGGFIYKTMNRLTGEVVNQFPREDVLRMRDTSAYVPGAVVNAKA